MKNYESPTMKFQELKFFEKIACDDCWSHKEFNYDYPEDGNIKFTPIILSTNGCGTTESEEALYHVYEFLNKGHGQQYKDYAANICDKPNTKMAGFYKVPGCS